MTHANENIVVTKSTQKSQSLKSPRVSVIFSHTLKEYFAASQSLTSAIYGKQISEMFCTVSYKLKLDYRLWRWLYIGVEHKRSVYSLKGVCLSARRALPPNGSRTNSEWVLNELCRNADCVVNGIRMASGWILNGAWARIFLPIDPIACRTGCLAAWIPCVRVLCWDNSTDLDPGEGGAACTKNT